MDAKGYLQSYGWQEGQALQKGGLLKPILVKHKKDTKGLGHGTNDGDLWWERLFDGQLKSLDVTSSGGNVVFDQNKQNVEASVRKSNSPLYRMFVKGQGLEGTVGKKTEIERKRKREFSGEQALEDMERMVRRCGEKKGREEKKERKEKRKDIKDKKDKKKKEKKEKKEKDKKEKEEKKEKKEKKDKKDKKDKKHKKDKKKKDIEVKKEKDTKVKKVKKVKKEKT